MEPTFYTYLEQSQLGRIDSSILSIHTSGELSLQAHRQQTLHRKCLSSGFLAGPLPDPVAWPELSVTLLSVTAIPASSTAAAEANSSRQPSWPRPGSGAVTARETERDGVICPAFFWRLLWKITIALAPTTSSRCSLKAVRKKQRTKSTGGRPDLGLVVTLRQNGARSRGLCSVCDVIAVVNEEKRRRKLTTVMYQKYR